MMGSNDKPQDPVAGSITPTRPTLVDTEASIIVDVEATPAHRTQEVWSTQTRIERVKEHFPGAAKKLIGDTAYGTAEFLSWKVVEQGIEPHGPVWDKGDSKHDRFGRADSRYDEQADSCTCPGGIPKDGFIRYRASLSDCSISSMKALCSPNTRTRKVVRSQHENVRDVVRAISQTTAYQRTRRDRKKVRKSGRLMQTFGLILVQLWRYHDPIETQDATART